MVSRFMLWTFLTYKTKADSVKSNLHLLENSTNNSLALKLPLHQIIEALTTKESVLKLTTFAPFIFVDTWNKYSINAENLRLIAMKYNTYVSVDENGSCCAFSNGSSMQLIDGTVRVDIWYHGEPDVDMWRCHTVKQLWVIILYMYRTVGFLYGTEIGRDCL